MLVAADNNFLLPNGTFIVEIIAFLIILGVLAKWVIPPVNRAAEARQEKLRKQFEAGRKAQAEAEAALEEYRAQLTAARADANRLREEAKEQGQAIIAEMREQAQAEASRVAAVAHRQLEADRKQTLLLLREEVGRLSTELASRIVGESLVDENRQHRVVDRFLAELEAEHSDGAAGRAGEAVGSAARQDA